MLLQGSGIGGQAQLEAQLQQLVKLGMKASDIFMYGRTFFCEIIYIYFKDSKCELNYQFTTSQ